MSSVLNDDVLHRLSMRRLQQKNGKDTKKDGGKSGIGFVLGNLGSGFPQISGTFDAIEGNIRATLGDEDGAVRSFNKYQEHKQLAEDLTPESNIDFKDIDSVGGAVKFIAQTTLQEIGPAILTGGIGGLATAGIKAATKSSLKKQVEAKVTATATRLETTQGLSKAEAARQAGQLVNRDLWKQAAKRGGVGSAIVTETASGAGEISGEAYDENGNTGGLKALAAGGLMGIVNALPVTKAIDRIIPDEVKGSQLKSAIADRAFNAAKAAGLSSIEEAGTEAFQTLIERAAIDVVQDRPIELGEDDWLAIAEATAGGGGVGLTTAGAGAAIAGPAHNPIDINDKALAEIESKFDDSTPAELEQFAPQAEAAVKENLSILRQRAVDQYALGDDDALESFKAKSDEYNNRLGELRGRIDAAKETAAQEETVLNSTPETGQDEAEKPVNPFKVGTVEYNAYETAIQSGQADIELEGNITDQGYGITNLDDKSIDGTQRQAGKRQEQAINDANTAVTDIQHEIEDLSLDAREIQANKPLGKEADQTGHQKQLQDIQRKQVDADRRLTQAKRNVDTQKQKFRDIKDRSNDLRAARDSGDSKQVKDSFNKLRSTLLSQDDVHVAGNDKPFKTAKAADRLLTGKRKDLADTHEVAEYDGGFVLAPKGHKFKGEPNVKRSSEQPISKGRDKEPSKPIRSDDTKTKQPAHKDDSKKSDSGVDPDIEIDSSRGQVWDAEIESASSTAAGVSKSGSLPELSRPVKGRKRKAKGVIQSAPKTVVNPSGGTVTTLDVQTSEGFERVVLFSKTGQQADTLAAGDSIQFEGHERSTDFIDRGNERDTNTVTVALKTQHGDSKGLKDFKSAEGFDEFAFDQDEASKSIAGHISRQRSGEKFDSRVEGRPYIDPFEDAFIGRWHADYADAIINNPDFAKQNKAKTKKALENQRARHEKNIDVAKRIADRMEKSKRTDPEKYKEVLARINTLEMNLSEHERAEIEFRAATEPSYRKKAQAFAKTIPEIDEDNTVSSDEFYGLIRSFRRNWKGAEIIAVESGDQLQDDFGDVWRKDGSPDIQGAEYKGKIYVFRKGHGDIKDVARSLLHEGHHKGSKIAYGKDLKDKHKQLWDLMGAYDGFEKYLKDHGIQMDVQGYIDRNRREDVDTQIDRLTDEFVAHIAQHHGDSKIKQLATDILVAIRQYLRSQGMYLQGSLPNDVMMEFIKDARSQLDSNADIDTSAKPAYRVIDEPENSDNPNFKKWFGNSKVVDDQGNPLVVYHGSGNAQDIYDRQFDPELTGRGNDQHGSGFYFTTSEATANNYTTSVAQNREGAGKLGGDTSPDVIDVYLSIQNPILLPQHANNLSDADIDVTAKQSAAIIRKAPDVYELDDSPIGNFIDIWSEGSVKDSMIDEVAQNYTGPTLTSLENDFFSSNPTAFREAIKEVLGYDGVIAQITEDEKHIIAWFPNQIKSASRNNGDFDPNKAGISYRLKSEPDERFGDRRFESQAAYRFGTTDGKKAFDRTVMAFMKGIHHVNNKVSKTSVNDKSNYLKYQFLDKFHYGVKRQRELEELGLTFTDENDFAAKASIWESIASDRQQKFRQTLRDDLIQLTADLVNDSITETDIGKFLHARHAHEANKFLAKAHNDPTDQNIQQLSGMSNADANKIIKKYASNAKMKALARKVDEINNFRMKTLMDAELITKDQRDDWLVHNQFFIPLKQSEHDDLLPNAGQGFSQSGKLLSYNAGQQTIDYTQVLAGVTAHAESAIVRAEKNEVGKTVLQMALDHKDKGFWDVVDTHTRKVYIPPSQNVPAQGVQTTAKRLHEGKVVDMPAVTDDNVLQVIIKGVPRYVVFNRGNEHAIKMAAGLKNLDSQKMNILVQQSMKAVRFISSLNTSYSPEFMVINPLRDVQTAYINLQSTPLKGKENIVFGKAGKSMKADRLRLPKMAKAIRDVERGKEKGTELERQYKLMREQGGKTGWIDAHASLTDASKNFNSLVAEAAANNNPSLKNIGSNLKGHARTFLQGMDNINAGAENAVRLASFVTAKAELGLSDQEAATIAKELTVNFNRRGAAGSTMNALFMFFNAAVQGSARLIQAMKSKRAQKMAAGIVGASTINHLVNTMLSGEDEDEENYYHSIPEYIRDMNMVVMNPFGEGSQPVKIPLPYGYNVFHVIGQIVGDTVLQATNAAGITDVRMGDNKGIMSQAGRLIGATAAAFNPLGSGPLAQTLSPTLVDPIIQHKTNENFAGFSLAREQSKFGVEKPAADLARANTPAIYTGISRAASNFTGGNEVIGGAINMNPDVMENYVNSVGGSALRFTVQSLGLLGSAGKTAVTRENHFELKNTPLARRLYGHDQDQSSKSRYYDRSRELDKLAKQLKVLKGEDRLELKKRPESKILGTHKQVKRQLSKLRAKRRELDDVGHPTDKVEKKILYQMRRLNKAYADAVHK